MEKEISKLSLVIPCYNEEEVIEETIKRLTAFYCQLKDITVELIFIDDGSKDRTRQILLEKAIMDDHIKVIGFSRNFGHQIAVTAGIDAAEGDAVVLIDADLQDPPEVICDMLKMWKEGYDVVYGTRLERPGESIFKLFTARIFYRTLNKLSEVPIPLDTGDFRLMDRKVVDVIKAMPEKARFIRGMVSWAGFKQIALPYKRAERFAGVSKYPLRKMLRFATDGILSFSTRPLQFAMGLGILSSGASFIGILYVLCIRLFTNSWVAGWTALMIAILFLGGVQLICVGILGEYIGRIYTETQSRPLYIIETKFGFNHETPSKIQ